MKRAFEIIKALGGIKRAAMFALVSGIIAAAIVAANAIPAVQTSTVNEFGPVIALTFDDGPYTGVTGHILDVLEENKVCATFFVLGSRIEGREELLERMEELNCEVGNHSFSHSDLTRLSRADCQTELESTDNEIRRVLGHGAAVVRPPYGSYNKSVLTVANRPLVLWTVDTNDWRGMDAEEIADCVIEQAKEGSVILMHDQQSQTADAMERIIPELIEEGFRFVTVSELIEITNGNCKGIKLPE